MSLQWCCLDNRLYNTHIPPWGVVLHIGVGLLYLIYIPMCKMTTPQGGIQLLFQFFMIILPQRKYVALKSDIS